MGKAPPTPHSFAAVRTPAGQTPTTPKPGVLTARVGGRAPLTPGLAGGPAPEVREDRRPVKRFTMESSAEELHSAPAPPRKPPPLRQTLELYFSDESLKQDRYLLGLINDSCDGWIDIETILSLKRVKALRSRQEDVLHALRDSWLEIHYDPETGGAALRRPPGHGPLPRLQAKRPQRGAPQGTAPAVADDDEGIVSADVTTQQRWDTVVKRAPAPSAGIAPQVPEANSVRAEVDPHQALRGTSRTGRLLGVIKSFNLRLSMGKITCVEIGREVAVDLADLSGFDVGDSVSFVLGTDPELGTPKAKELKFAASGMELELDPSANDVEAEEDWAPQPLPVRPAARPAQRAAPAKKTPVAAQPPAKVRRVAAPEQPSAPPEEEEEEEQEPEAHKAEGEQLEPGTRVVGVVQAIDPETGTGSVMCEALGGLIEIAAESLAGFEEGDSVSFAVSESGEAVEVEAA